MAEYIRDMPPETYGLVCVRKDGELITNVAHRKVYHSPAGFEIGYGGSGPADLALNTLMYFTDEKTAFEHHQEFKWKYIATMKQEGGTIPAGTIRKFIEEKRRRRQ